MSSVRTAVEWSINCEIESVTWDEDGGWHYRLNGTSWNASYSDSQRPVTTTDRIEINVYSKTLMAFLFGRLGIEERLQQETTSLGYHLLSGHTGCVVIAHNPNWTGITIALGEDNDGPFERIADRGMALPDYSINLRLRFDLLQSGGGSSPEMLDVEGYECGCDAYASMPPTFSLVRSGVSL